MNQETKLLFGKILGEIYKTQQMIAGDEKPNVKTYGLLNGIEDAIDEEIRGLQLISNEKFELISDVLFEIFDDEEKVEKFIGYYQIEPTLKSHGIQRWEAIRVLKYMNANDMYTNLIEKMDSSGSPGELRRLQLTNFDW